MKTTFPKHFSPLLLITGVLLATPAFALQRCELNGESVNLNNGNSTAGKSGLVRCWNDDTLQREEELRNGKFMGKRVFYSRDGRKETTVNEKGNLDGPAREYYADGKLKQESAYSNGERVGVLKSYFPSGKLERISFAAVTNGANRERSATIDYTEDGRLRGLQCGTRSLLPEDRVPCGFNGADSKVEIIGGRAGRERVVKRQGFRDGVLVDNLELDEDGKPANSYSFKDGIETAREYFPDGKTRSERAFAKQGTERNRDGVSREWASNGQMIAETRYAGGFETGGTQWYMNGSIKAKRSLDGRGRDALVKSEDYYDSGKLRAREVTRASRPRGKQEFFDEAGVLREEAMYDDAGVLKSKRVYDEGGKLTADDEYFEDGSRKRKLQ